MEIKDSSKIVKECPLNRATFWSRMTFWWFNSMIKMGYKKPLEIEDMWELMEENRAEVLQQMFNKHWLPALETPAKFHKSSKHSFIAEELDLALKNKEMITNETKGTKQSKKLGITRPNIIIPIIKTFRREIIETMLLRLLFSTIIFITPILLDALMNFTRNNDPNWIGITYALGMLVVYVLESFLTGQYEFKIDILCIKIRTVLVFVVYKKVLVLSSAARMGYSTGEVVNLMSVDIEKIAYYIRSFNMLWSVAIQIILAICLLWQKLGIAALNTIAIAVIIISLYMCLSRHQFKINGRLMKHRGERLKYLSEIISGIGLLKFYAWEQFFEQKVKAIRKKEINCILSRFWVDCALNFFVANFILWMALATFTTYALTNSEHSLDAKKAFVSLSLFNILRAPMGLLPQAITATTVFLVSLKRLNNFLQLDEIDSNAISHFPNEENAVVIEHGYFSWSKNEEPTLEDINLKIEKGSLVAIVGQVGSGKSSLLSALVEEMEKTSGTINIEGSIAYVPQLAWIQNNTLKENILHTKVYQKIKYDNIIEACALIPDLEVLPEGDETEIGEKGVNLSGGQKQRVSVARAIYRDADIYLFDDPLSAVDINVSQHLFKNVIGKDGLLKSKTRILVTHHISVLSSVDTIIHLKNGKICEIGSYQELMTRAGGFSKFLHQYLGNDDADGSPLVEEIPSTEKNLNTKGNLMNKNIDNAATTSRRTSTATKSTGNGILSKDAKSLAVSFREVNGKKNNVGKAKLIKAEEVEIGSVKATIYLDYFKAFSYLGFLAFIVAHSSLAAFNLAGNIWIKSWDINHDLYNESSNIYNRSSSTYNESFNEYNGSSSIYQINVYAGIGCGELLTSVLMITNEILCCTRAGYVIHNKMLRNLLKAPILLFHTTPMGRILNRFSNDVNITDEMMRPSLRITALCIFRVLIIIGIISYEIPFFMAVVLPLALVYHFVKKFYITTSRQLQRLESITRSPIYSHFSETVVGAVTIKAYGTEGHFIKRNNNLMNTNTAANVLLVTAVRWLSIRLEFLGYTTLFASALFVVYMRESLTPGIVGLCMIYALEMVKMLNGLVKYSADLEMNIIAVERCIEYTKLPSEAHWKSKDEGFSANWLKKGVIIFQKYCTRYHEDLDLVLRDISCTINSNEKIGIVGRTGAGKSSLVLGLLRIIEPSSGTIMIDNVDISQIGLHELRNKLTVIPQDPFLFTGTIRMNIDPFNKYSDDQIWEILELAHIKTLITSFKEGLNYEIFEGGENISVGQRQLICLARALLRKTKILILDEATAAVDVETDEIIQATIRTAFSNCTILTIAHRLNTILDYDRIMVLQDGRIVEFDSPEILLNKKETLFYSMAKDSGIIQ